jgi:hypothetical protein
VSGRLKTWAGLVKVKMLHKEGGTVLLPEVLIVGAAGNQWAQPQYVFAPQVAFMDEEAFATIRLAVLDRTMREEGGLDCRVTFSQRDRVAALPDRSEIYRCQVTAGHSPAQLTVGRARVRADGGIDLKLHHHTGDVTLPLIHASGHVRGSTWNFQGTRELANVSYAYFTSLPSVSSEAHLRAMAMSSTGTLSLRVDGNPGARPDLVLDVYRESTRNRTATLTLWVPGEGVSTPHVWKHTGLAVHYEVAHPWVQRVGLQRGENLRFRGVELVPDRAALERFDYAVIGDCTTVAGLRAPFDEEDTSETFTVQDLSETNVFDFWAAHANESLHAPPVDVETFKG